MHFQRVSPASLFLKLYKLKIGVAIQRSNEPQTVTDTANNPSSSLGRLPCADGIHQGFERSQLIDPRPFLHAFSHLGGGDPREFLVKGFVLDDQRFMQETRFR